MNSAYICKWRYTYHCKKAETNSTKYDSRWQKLDKCAKFLFNFEHNQSNIYLWYAANSDYSHVSFHHKGFRPMQENDPTIWYHIRVGRLHNWIAGIYKPKLPTNIRYCSYLAYKLAGKLYILPGDCFSSCFLQPVVWCKTLYWLHSYFSNQRILLLGNYIRT